MCGFLIEYTPKNITAKEKFLELLALSNKRGPDFQGYDSHNDIVQFGFNRLAILDLSLAGQQPMTSYNNRYLIVFNGEIYNHLDLRKKLVFKKFKGFSDTETSLP
jgi:asparagine synthase (glutamine-hydrolysing)